MNLKPVIFYILYTVIVFFIFAWVFFPSQKAADLLSGKLNGYNNYIEVKIRKVKPRVFFTCKIEQSEVIINNKVKLLFDYIKVAPSIFSIFLDEKKGNIIFSDIFVKIEDIPMLKSMEMSELNFNSIALDYAWKKEKVEIRNFTAKGSQCNIQVHGNIYFSGKVDKSKKTTLDLEVNIELNPLYSSKFAGIPSVASLSNDPSHEGIKLNISGTLENPKFKL
jgi:hypothetical protein